MQSLRGRAATNVTLKTTDDKRTVVFPCARSCEHVGFMRLIRLEEVYNSYDAAA